jgi:hypothetical protein
MSFRGTLSRLKPRPPKEEHKRFSSQEALGGAEVLPAQADAFAGANAEERGKPFAAQGEQPAALQERAGLAGATKMAGLG